MPFLGQEGFFLILFTKIIYALSAGKKENMKHVKKLFAFVLAFAMIVTLTTGYVAKATSTLTVTFRMEMDESTAIKPVSITLTDADKKDYGIGLSTTTLTPLHAMAKLFTEHYGATEETMKNYIGYSNGWVSGISKDGTCDKEPYGSAASGTQDNVYWMFSVNDCSPQNPDTEWGYSMSEYPLQDKDKIVIYGLWSGYPEVSYYTTFDKEEYRTAVGSTIDVSIKGLGSDDISGKPAALAVSGASVMVDNVEVGVTDTDGKVSLSFDKEGTYELSAKRKAADGIHYDISRPYAKVTVTKKVAGTSVKKLEKPSSVKVKVKKFKKNKKKLTISWKKVKNATKYNVYISKKKKKGYKKVAVTKKTKVTLKKKKGTYFVRVKAKFGKLTSAYSKTVKVKA